MVQVTQNFAPNEPGKKMSLKARSRSFFDLEHSLQV